MLKDIKPYSIVEFKKVHGIMTYLTVEESGKFRGGDEGVFDGNKCIFVCPSPKMVNSLMNDLFKFIKSNKDKIHPLILSCIFHYEFVFIHPFSDGNGRMARLWQNFLLYNYRNIFEFIPIESSIFKYQNEYYKAINDSNIEGNSNKFICFMLRMIEDAIDEVIEVLNKPTTNEEVNINNLLDVMGGCKPLTAKEIMIKLKIKSKETFRNSYLNPAVKYGLVSLTVPDKPTSKNQRYYIE